MIQHKSCCLILYLDRCILCKTFWLQRQRSLLLLRFVHYFFFFLEYEMKYPESDIYRQNHSKFCKTIYPVHPLANNSRSVFTKHSLTQTGRVCRRQFQIWWKWQKVIQTGRKHCGKKRNCSLRAISLFFTVFSKGLFPRGVKRCYCVGMG